MASARVPNFLSPCSLTKGCRDTVYVDAVSAKPVDHKRSRLVGGSSCCTAFSGSSLSFSSGLIYV